MNYVYTVLIGIPFGVVNAVLFTTLKSVMDGDRRRSGRAVKVFNMRLVIIAACVWPAASAWLSFAERGFVRTPDEPYWPEFTAALVPTSITAGLMTYRLMRRLFGSGIS